MINIKQGNILNCTENIICQLVYCQGMYSGLDNQIINSYPKVYAEYVKLVNWQKKEYKRGNAKSKYLLGSVQFVQIDNKKVIANLFGQLKYSRNKQYIDYKALKKGLYGVLETVTWDHSKMKGYSVAIPYDLVGGDWNIFESIIEEVFKEYAVNIYVGYEVDEAGST